MSIIVKITQDPSDTRYLRFSNSEAGPTHLFETEGEVIDYLLDDFPRNRWKGYEKKSSFIKREIRPKVDLAKEIGVNYRHRQASHFRFDAAPDDMIGWGAMGQFHRSRLSEACDILFYESHPDLDDVGEGKLLEQAGILVPYPDDA